MTTPGRYGAVALAALCLLAGCNGLLGPTETATPTPSDSTASPATGGPTPTPTPADRLGVEGGYAATDPLDANASDGLNSTELNATVARTMARVELIRGLEFEEPVPVEVVSREEYRERNLTFVERRDPRLTEGFWEALFLVGEDANATAVVDDVFGGGVVGYYADGRIVLVGGASPQVDTGTLAHELVHALQDQQFGQIDRGETFDGRVAAQGLTEGDAVYVERAHGERCDGEWSCLPRPPASADAGAIARHPGVYLAFVQPYVTGPAYVGALRNRSGGDWTAVNEAYVDPPRASEQVIHPEAYPDERPTNVTVPDRSGPNWTRAGRDTVGEGAVHVMFWANGLVPREDDSVSTDYAHRRSAGWDGDALVVYEGSARSADAENGTAYVWRTTWENETEAREFQRSYRAMLLVRHGAREAAPRTYVTGSGTFADAFRVVRRGETVTVVNAPTVEALAEVHAP